jgi:hypothetical protein
VGEVAVRSEEEVATDSVGEVVVTDWPWEVVATDLVVVTVLSLVVTHLADLAAVALVENSAGREDLLRADLSVAEITAALMTVVSAEAITVIIALAVLMGTLLISALRTLEIQITLIITHIRITTTMGM